jgi:hypothetical protein
MNYLMHLILVTASVSRREVSEASPADQDLAEVLEPVVQRFRETLKGFIGQAKSPQVLFDLEQQLWQLAQEQCRVCLEWTLNHLEPNSEALPSHVDFGSSWYTRQRRQTPREIATLFGKIVVRRASYRVTDKSKEPTLFPLEQELGIVQGATPALAERAARYHAEAGATQDRTRQRLKQEHGVNWGVKKLRQVLARVSRAMSEQRQEVQVEKLLELLKRATESKGRHLPVLSLGRDGITLGLRVHKGTIYEVASAGTISVMDRRGNRLGTVYVAHTPESLQPTLSHQLQALTAELLRRWEGVLPRLCYVTDAGDNETAFYHKVLRPMRHPRTGERLNWLQVVDYYHASERLWTMAESLFGSGPTAKAWVRRMQKLLLKPGGVRRVLLSAAALRGRLKLAKNAEKTFFTAYNYLRTRTKCLRYAAYRQVGVPLGSGVTEAACKTIYTQRLKQSGMHWHWKGAQMVLDLRVLLLSGVWTEAYQCVLKNLERVKVPAYTMQNRKPLKIAA